LNCRLAVGSGEDCVVRSQRATGRRNEDHLDPLDLASLRVLHLHDQRLREWPADGVYLQVPVDHLDDGGFAGAGKHQIVATAGLESQQGEAHNNS
jgi:hypothetical protein